jgi:ABC-2 type transport system ATP-binding protein
MFHDPKVLLLDEPSSALDPVGRQDVVEIIESLKARGKTIFLSTHILNDIERVCDRIGILHGGRVVIEDSLDAVLKGYVEPIYDISLRQDAKRVGHDREFAGSTQLGDAVSRMEKALGDLEFVQKTWRESGQISVAVRDVATDCEGLFRCLAPFGALIEGVAVRRTSLESIYMKVVNGDAS